MKILLRWLMGLLYSAGRPISVLWESVYRLRRFAYTYGFFQQHQFRVPIISVGNLSFGGTGKTPFTIFLAQKFEAQNKLPMILLRGYKGKLENGKGLLDSSRELGPNVEDFGDEALLYFRKLKKSLIMVGKDRVKNLELNYSKAPADIVFLDDGHQHLKIYRDLNIVLFDALMPLEKYQVPPGGYLREGLSSLKDADLLACGRVDLVPAEKINQLKQLFRQYVRRDIPFIEFKYVPVGFYSFNREKILTCSQMQGKDAIVVSGIASPLSFLESLKKIGINIVDTFTFADHYQYDSTEIQEIVTLAQQKGATVLTTEKDIVKIKRYARGRSIYYLEIAVEIVQGADYLDQALARFF